MLDFRIDTFLAVCRTMNYTKAAQELNITQPAVSNHIRWLEQEYGAELFSFHGKQARLTQAGMLLRSAAVTARHDQNFLRRCMQQPQHAAHDLRFGATPTVGSYLLPVPLASYQKKYPQADIHLRVQNTEALCRALDLGEIDFAIVEGYVHKQEYEARLYCSERYLAVCAAGYSMASGEPQCLADLLAETLLIREHGSGNREIIKRSLEQHNLALEDFRSVLEIGDMQVLKAMLLQGCGVSFLYEAAVREELCSGTLREIPLADVQESHDITFLWRKGSMFSEHYQELYELLCLSRKDKMASGHT